MKKRMIVLAVVLVLLMSVTGTVLAKGGAQNGVFVRFNQVGYFPGMDMSYCEGYFLRTGNGIVHEWRKNPECAPYAPIITETSLHLIFKPASKFTEADCDDAGLVIEIPGQWTLDSGYIDLDGDEADLRDFLGQDGEDFWWVCFYTWDTN